MKQVERVFFFARRCSLQYISLNVVVKKSRQPQPGLSYKYQVQYYNCNYIHMWTMHQMSAETHENLYAEGKLTCTCSYIQVHVRVVSRLTPRTCSVNECKVFTDVSYSYNTLRNT